MGKRQLLIRWLLVIVVCCSGLLLCRDIQIGDNALDLLPGEAVKSDLGLLQDMGLVDRIFITVTNSGDASGGGTKELFASVDRLAADLSRHDEIAFVMGHLPKGFELSLFNSLWQMVPYLLDSYDLEELRKATTQAGIEQTLRNTFSVLNTPAGFALKEQVSRDPLGLMGRVLQKLNYLRSEFSMELADGYFVSRDRSSCLVIVQSRLSLTDSEQASRINALLERAFAENLGPGIQAGIIGTLPHTLANSRTIQEDLRILLPVASVLLLLLLLIGLRNVRGFLVLGVVFLAAPPAIGITGLLYSPLSRMALGFGIVLLGIAVDFAIHLYLALREGKGSRKERQNSVRRPVLYASLTTLAVLIVLLFSEVPSHRQMATLAITGVIFAVSFSWLLIPTLAGEELVGDEKRSERAVFSGAQSTAFRFVSVTVWLLLLTAGIMAWPKLSYNGDLRVLDAPDDQVLVEEARFSQIWGNKGEQAFIIARSADYGLMLDLNYGVYEKLLKLPVKSFQSFAPLIPGPAKQQHNYDNWKTFWSEKGSSFAVDFMNAAKALGFADTAFEPFFTFLKSEPEPADLQALMNGPLAPLFHSMTSEKDDYEGGGPEYLALTTVALTEATDLSAILALERELPGITVIANLKWRAGVETLLKHDIFTLSMAAAVSILVLVWLQFRSLRSVISVIAPVLAALAAMIVYSWLTGAALNMMHLIMGIMVIGLSVDYGIFIVCASRETGSSHSWKAVSICAASSIIGFGVLAFAEHPALHSLGITVLVGIGAAWPTALWVSPALLGVHSSGKVI